MTQAKPKTDGIDRTRALAEDICGLTFDALSPDDVAQLKRLLLDHLGVGLRGSALPWGLALQKYATPYNGTGKCTIYGSTLKTTLPVAALVNGTSAHGLEMDDTHDQSLSHPGCLVIATALAAGQVQERSGAEILVAIAAGYEVMARAGLATGAQQTVHKGFHSTALYGGFGAAAAAGLLIGLDTDRMCRAWGLMLSMAGGSKQFAHDPYGTTVKRLHGGMPAHNGALAAELSAHGIDGPDQSLDGIFGLGNLFGDDPQPERLLRAPGEKLQIHNISFKPYPCCRLFHSTIDALGELTDDFKTAPDDIEKIHVGAPEVMITQHMMRRPDSVMAAQYALPHALAASLIADPYAYESYEEDTLHDPAILALADRIDASRDPEIEKDFPAHFGSSVEVTLRSGEQRRVTVMDSQGTPARPFSQEALEEKFRTLAQVVKPAIDSAAVFELVETLPAADSIEPLLGHFEVR
ncbi:MAG: MmgE/PrpD family protein [Alphaproteobacteria bacterium]|nr:MmgE/PrpD family protein [Alphaproteobacteria bacterium]